MFRLPSALDNRPLEFSEFESKIDQILFVSATPAEYEEEHEMLRAEQVIRPTGLLDPEVEVRPIEGQIDDLIGEDPQGNGTAQQGAHYYADQADGGGSDRLYGRTRYPCQIYAFRH